MANDVKVVINLATAPGQQSFGIPLIMAGKQSKATPYTQCSSLKEVKDAGFAETTDTYKTAQLLFMQSDAPAKLAVCGATTDTVAALDTMWAEDWRQLIVTSIGTESESTAAEISAYIETTDNRMFFTSVDDLSNADALNGKERTVCMYYTGEDYKCPEAALVGATAGLTVGGFTYKNVILKGITPMVLKDADIEAAHAKNTIAFVTKAGDNVTSEGKTCSGEYVDIVDSKDYIIQNIEYRCQKVLNKSAKLPYDNNGIAALESEVLSVLVDAYNNGIIGVNDENQPDYTVTFATRNETTAADRTARKYNGGTFTFGLAGAIHNAEITGEIIV